MYICTRYEYTEVELLIPTAHGLGRPRVGFDVRFTTEGSALLATYTREASCQSIAAAAAARQVDLVAIALQAFGVCSAKLGY